ncbi:adenylosuccinate synthetase [bacterium]|nr:adenylosuccinate synthetase [bacterium]
MSRPSVLIAGAQFGDEGKGKIVDLLVQKGDLDVVVRFNGGANAGHTIVLDDGKYPLHLIPSGILHKETINIIAAGVVVDPLFLVKEIENLKTRGITCDNLFISDRAHMVMPWHRAIDAAQGGRLGTTAKGIGPTYEDRAGRRGIRVGDMIDENGQIDLEHFSRRVKEVCAEKNNLFQKVHNLDPLNADDIIREFVQAAEVIKGKVRDTGAMIAELIKQGKTFLYEGAQGSLLDVDWGTYPYVTSSSVGLAGCYVGTGNCVLPDIRMGVVKAYGTRVGEGHFPAELGEYERIKEQDKVAPGGTLPPLTDEEKALALNGDDYWMGRWLRSVGAEYGTTTGRPRRCGWLDIVAVRQAVRMSGLNQIALTKLDVLDGIPKLKVCVAYEYQGKRTTDFPARIHHLHDYKPVYEELEGWDSLGKATSFDDLPEQAKTYVKKLEEWIGVPIKIVSVGSHRASSLWR